MAPTLRGVTPPREGGGVLWRRSAEVDFLKALRVVFGAAVRARDGFDFGRGPVSEERAVVDFSVPDVPLVHEVGC